MIIVADITNTLKEAKRLAKKIKNEGWDTNIKIAVLGTASIQHFVMVLRYMMAQEGFFADIYEGEYNGIAMDVFDEKSELYFFDPDIVILYTHYLDVKQFPSLSDEDIYTLADRTISYYIKVWEALSKIRGVQILQTNFVYPPEHVLGNLETACGFSKTNFYKILNDKLIESAADNVIIIDVELLSEYVGKYNWFDYPSYFLTKTGFRIDYLEDIVTVFVSMVKALKGKIKKCIVLDLDNTLWGGVVGEEGYDGIQLDPNNAIGEAYRYFQQYLLELKQRGIILAVCSKNNEENAKEPFEKNPDMILKLDDIACFMSNWKDKASNLKAIAAELNIGVESLVFFDDNPAEREIVRTFLPEVHVVDVPEDPALYAVRLDKEAPFEWLQITKEDLIRNNSYIQNSQRKQLEQNFVNYNDYLKALEMKGSVKEIERAETGRFTQLLNKTNQFNLRTKRYMESDISAMLGECDKKCVAVKLSDKFSEYGIISCIIIEKQKNKCFVESWVMSCRVLKRGVENYAFVKIIEEAQKWRCDEIIGEYISSRKNKMVEKFYDTLGFELLDEREGVKTYKYDLTKPFHFVNFINEKEGGMNEQIQV